jgi:hypothetical protein
VRREEPEVGDAGQVVSFRAAFERHPAAVKGAFLLRGADGLPHQVRLGSARAAEVTGAGEERIALAPAVLEIAPTMDTFVPFEVSTLDLLPGWYQLECEVMVDGVPALARPGEPFSMPWPRSQVRRGTVAVGRTVGEVRIEAVECAGDSIRVRFTSASAPHVRLRADDTPLHVLSVEHDVETGVGRIRGYPVLRSHERLTIELRGELPLEIPLP